MPHPDPRLVETEIIIPAGARRLGGILRIPQRARAVVAFAHGSGSGRFSERNQFVASILRTAGLATLLMDLLEEPEASDRDKVFDIPLLAERLQAGAAWLAEDEATRDLPLGYFGASTGAAAALVAAANEPGRIGAIVSRGGRPDLAASALDTVRAPTLLIVGGADGPVIDLNRMAWERLSGTRELIVIPRATHLFPEPGALEDVAHLARDWFARHLAPGPPSPVRG